ncbi:MAG: NAD-dependent epimerase/dehydratase family protein [Gemmobacter sp.]
MLVAGATGRLGRFLMAAWGDGSAAGIAPLWAGRSIPLDVPRSRRWDPGNPDVPMPPADVLILLSGVTSGPGAALAQNAVIARAALDAARAAGVGHVFLASSAAVYGPTGPDAAAEDRAPAPVRPYGEAKLEMEKQAQGRAQVTVLRIGNVAGADLLGQAIRSGPVRLDRFASGSGPVRSYIGPQSLARVLATLARRAASGQPLPPVLNLAAPGRVAMEDLLRAAGIPFDWQPAPPDAIEHVVMATDRLCDIVRFDPAESTPQEMVAQLRTLSGASA